MRIGIITFWWTEDNYGQILQMYALQRYLREQGHSPFLIRYNPLKEPAPSREANSYIKFINPVNILNGLKRRIKSKYQKKRVLKEVSENPRYFEDFRNKELKMSSITYNSIDELQLNPPEADAYIVGSDQVWNFPDIIQSGNKIKAYFLDFGDSAVRRISYAASFSRETFDKEFYSVVKPLINKFHKVSVREKSGIDICKFMGREDAQVVLDPTLILASSQWATFANINIGRDMRYCFLYLLGNETDFDMKEINNYVSNNQLEIKYVASQGRYDDYEKIYPNIYDWLGLISNSQIMITNSFHGVVFAIIFNKPFVVLPLKGDFHGSMNTRIDNILSKLGLVDRICKSSDIEEVSKKTINWALVNEILEKERLSSYNFIQNALMH